MMMDVVLHTTVLSQQTDCMSIFSWKFVSVLFVVRGPTTTIGRAAITCYLSNGISLVF